MLKKYVFLIFLVTSSVFSTMSQVVGTPYLVINSTGSGKLSGRTCIDVIATGGTHGQGGIAERTVESTRLNPVKGKMDQFTFTPDGVVSNVRFSYTNNTSGIGVNGISNITGDKLEANISSPVIATVTYNSTDLAGKKRMDNITSTITVTYNDEASGGGNDHTESVTVILQDQGCCGAYANSAHTEWLAFMCHNLGADQSLDPSTHVVGSNPDGSQGTLGALYQWGRKTDGHQLRNSVSTDILATDAYNAGNQFIYRYFNWISGSDNPTLWGDGTQNATMERGPNDPCPTGWKVPTQQQWSSIFGGADAGETSSSLAQNNTWAFKNSVYWVGNELFLPMGGWREYNNASLNGIQGSAHYWSSTTTSGSGAALMVLSTTTVWTDRRWSNYRAYGFSVRCIAQ